MDGVDIVQLAIYGGAQHCDVFFGWGCRVTINPYSSSLDSSLVYRQNDVGLLLQIACQGPV